MKHIGFTGTKDGMTQAQFGKFQTMMLHPRYEYMFHHGDCIGADCEAHNQIVTYTKNEVVVHQPDNDKYQCPRRPTARVTILPRKPYLKRNKDIVNESDLLIATPATPHEVLRSGTWATIRYARKKGIDIYIINPDGKLIKEKNEIRI